MRDALDKHYADAGKYPTSLEDLVAKRYLRAIPKDPFTQSAATWVAGAAAGHAQGQRLRRARAARRAMSGTEPRAQPIANPAFFAPRAAQSPAPRAAARAAEAGPGDRRSKALTPASFPAACSAASPISALLIVVAMMGMASPAFGELYSHAAQREKEARAALRRRAVPRRDRELLQRRVPATAPTRRSSRTWSRTSASRCRCATCGASTATRSPAARTGALVEMPDGRHHGRLQPSEETPIKQATSRREAGAFDDADSYTKWTFTYSPSSAGQTAPASVAQAQRSRAGNKLALIRAQLLRPVALAIPLLAALSPRGEPNTVSRTTDAMQERQLIATVILGSINNKRFLGLWVGPLCFYRPGAGTGAEAHTLFAELEAAGARSARSASTPTTSSIRTTRTRATSSTARRTRSTSARGRR